ncbi:MAG: nucleotide exchange factor GrpE [Chloroflexota bacterium]|nr:nucleotide exchange factor GrpE [Chloroflexota bacterium]MDE2959860.1 nucleotide exchange factor GrpE [Chloroflexota bacterium]
MAIDETQPPDARQPDDLEPGTLASDFYAPGPAEPQEGSADEPPMTPEQEAAMLRMALAEANEEIARQADAVQRGHADLANARRRHDEERLTIQRQANSRLLVGLLPIVDELDLAVNHLESGATAPTTEASDSWAEGVRLIQRKLAVFLESQGVARIECLGEPFNPELHEAVGMAQVGDAESGSIVEVLRQGYRLHDRVVQVAQVVVNQ